MVLGNVLHGQALLKLKQTQGYACACQKQQAAAQRVSAALCHLPTAHSQSSWLPCRQALWHVWTSPGIWLSIWSETPCGSRACNPAVGSAGRADLEGRLWQAGETSPGGNLHVFHWQGSWQAGLLHSFATAIYSWWAVRVRLPAYDVPAVIKHHIFFAIFLSVSMRVHCVMWVHCSCLKNSACGIKIERNPQPVLWQAELENSSNNCLCFALSAKPQLNLVPHPLSAHQFFCLWKQQHWQFKEEEKGKEKNEWRNEQCPKQIRKVTA